MKRLPWKPILGDDGKINAHGKDLMLDALNLDLMSVHSDDPGPTGTLHRVSKLEPVIFRQSVNGSRTLRYEVVFDTSLDPMQERTVWLVLWDRNGGNPKYFISMQVVVRTDESGSTTILPGYGIGLV